MICMTETPQTVDRDAVKALGFGIVLAFGALCFQNVTFLLHPLITLVHELGHTVAAWLFGYPSIPTFDFEYGGGETVTYSERHLFVVLVFYALMIGWGYAWRRQRAGWMTVSVVLAIYSLCAWTSAAQVLILLMGHGGELAFATFAIHRALNGGNFVHDIERPLYAFCGFFVSFFDIRFAFRLCTDPDVRTEYEQGKGNGLLNDFFRVATDYWHVDLSIVTWLFFGLSILSPILSFLLFRYRSLAFDVLDRLDGGGSEVLAAVHVHPISQHSSRVSEGSGGIHVLIDGVARGPFDQSSIRGMIQAGTLTPDSLCWRDGMPDWTPVAEVIPSIRIGLK